ncbi:unnamed protein product [Penicillium pancosmium]
MEDSPGQAPGEVLVGELIQHANGVFQWVRLTIPLIKQRALEGESMDDIRSWLREVPAGLEDVYVYILNNVIAARNRDQSLLFFQWRWEKIHGFVESDGRMKRIIKALAGGLAEVVSGTVQVVHQSVNDFLRAKGLALLYSISASTASIDRDNLPFHCQAALYRSCLVYLATITKEISNFQGLVINLVENHPFLHYTTINLFVHAEKAAGAELLQNEKDILEQIINGWVSVYLCFDSHENSPACPPIGTKVLHMAATVNLIDVIKSVLSDGENIEIKEIQHYIPQHVQDTQWLASENS